MYDSYDSIRNMVLHRTSDWHFSEISLNGIMIDLLYALNGQDTIEEIKTTLDLGETELCRAITRLFIEGLVAESPGFKFVTPDSLFPQIMDYSTARNITL